MTQRTWKPRKPYMIERDGKLYGQSGHDYAKITFGPVPGSVKIKWVDWEGSRYATHREATDAMTDAGITGASIIEIIEETRMRS